MNLILWTLSGGLIGVFFGRFFADSQAILVGDLVAGLIGAIGFGYISKLFIPNTRGRDLHQQSFSPGALLWAVIGAIIVLAIFNALV